MSQIPIQPGRYQSWIILWAILVLPQLTAMADTGQDSVARYHPAGTTIHNILPEEEPVDPSDAIISGWFSRRSNDNDISLRLLNHKKDPSGREHYRYLQYYKGLPVAQSMIHIHYRSGYIYSYNGTYFSDNRASTHPVLDAATARRYALAAVPATKYIWDDDSLQALLPYRTGNSGYGYAPAGTLCFLPVGTGTQALKLAYCFDIYALEPLQRQWVYIDAMTGQLLYTEERIQTTDRPGIAHTRYSGMQSIMCDSISPGLFALQESGRGGGIATYNAAKGYGATTIKFTDDNNDWNNVNDDQDEVATDVHWGMEMAFDYFKSKLLRSSYDNANAAITGMVHSGIKYNNAHWDGTFASFGDGDSLLYRPLVTPDICIHELSHGITGTTAKLVYLDEMGAINESFSDIFAKCALHYALPASFNWNIGEGVLYSGKPMRDMKDPHTTRYPKYYRGLYYYFGHDDYGGVHTNSSVQNYWFYLLCEGGSGIRESDGAPFTVTPIGLAHAEQIAYSTLTDYLFPLAQYKDVATLSLTAAATLYGAASDEALQVQMAWYAVGLADKPVSVTEAQVTAPYTVAPNPSSGTLCITAANPGRPYSLRLVNLLGQTLLSRQDFSGNTLDISSIIPGTYILELTEAGQVFRVKFSRN